MTRSAKLVALALAGALSIATSTSHAHDFEPGVLVLEEIESERGSAFRVVWSEPVDTQGLRSGVTVTYPPGCVRTGDELGCDGQLHGSVTFGGLHESRTQVVVLVRWRDGRSFERLVTGAAPRVEIEPGPGREAWQWVRLGIEHIALGYDHVAFVLGLLLIVGLHRRLVATITAFTVAHSISLALAATGVVRLPVRAVEATIALSVVLVAREALGERPTLTRRRPYLVAFGFGLIHGLGFASALRQVGLPRDGRAFALAFFNIGVEIGQLSVVALAGVFAWGTGRLMRASPKPRIVLAYAIGSLGAVFFVDRVGRIMGL